MAKRIITISREFGSGGRFIGEEVAKKLGIAYYDKNIIGQIAEKSGLSPEYIQENAELSPKKGLFAYAFSGRDITGKSVEDMVYEVQRNIILELAEKEPCVIIGRNADYILKDRDDVQQTDYFNQHQVECARRAAKLLTQKLTVHQTIEQLAQDVGLSATALKTCFKSVYGSSVYAYQKEYRLQLAQKLLTETDSTIAEIAHQVGYENPNKFSSAFRQSLGMTPTQYRKMRPIG